MRQGFIILVALVLSCAAPSAVLAQATQPAVRAAAPALDDPYKDKLLAARESRAATTQATARTAAGADNSDPYDLKRLGIALAVVVGAIFLTQKVWKRMGLPGAGGRASGALQVVSRLSVSPKQQVMLLRVGRRLVLVANNGAQMSPLCQIDDPEEAAAILGATATEQPTSASASFSAVLGGEEKDFEDRASAEAEAAREEAEIATTRDELNGLMDRVRTMSRQFKGA
jgi:flagellar biogenesis protein FliO